MSDEELYEEVASAESWAGRPFTHASELAERVDLTRQGVRQRLEDLVDEREDIERYKPSRDVIYYAE